MKNESKHTYPGPIQSAGQPHLDHQLEKTQEQVLATQHEHREIWEAIKKGDNRLAKHIMKQHLLRVEQRYLAILSTGQELTPP